MNDPNPPLSRLSFADLAIELQRMARREPEALEAWVAGLSLRQQAELALRLPAEQRLELLLNAPRSMRLVRSIPAIDVYLTVREVGPADALPLLAKASATQLRHLIDLESWRRDRFDAARSGAWIAVLLEAGEPTLRRFLKNTEDDLLTLLVQSWMRVKQIEYEDSPGKYGHGEGEADAGSEESTITPDGYYRFSPEIPEHGPAIQRILQLFFIEQPERYQRILWDSVLMLPSELEEAAYRWRCSRLEEHGFPGEAESLEVYAPPARAVIAPPSAPATPDDPDSLGAGRTGMSELDRRGPLAAVVDRLDPDRREQALLELVSVANRILVADGRDTGDPEAHRTSLSKAGTFVDIALQAGGATDAAGAAEIISRTAIVELYRQGWSQVVELQQRARKLAEKSWAVAGAMPFELLDPPVGDRLDALLEVRPRYVEIDDDRLEIVRRDFAATTEIDETRAAVEMAEALDAVLIERLGVDPAAISGIAGAQPVRFSTLLLTLLAWSATRDELRGDPLPRDVASDFVRNIASRRTAPPEAAARALEGLLRRLREPFRLDARELAVLQALGRSALERLREECGGADPGVPLDRRFVSCLLLE